MSAKYNKALLDLVKKAFEEGRESIHEEQHWAIYEGMHDEAWDESQSKKDLEKYLKGEH